MGNLFGITSVLGNSIILTEERWAHITETHPELENNMDHIWQTIRNPDEVRIADKNKYIAIQSIRRRFLNVVYSEKEGDKDGFVITAFYTKEIREKYTQLPKLNF